MKQKQANIVEAHLAREQTEVAADQSRSVMIFTIFTIIFLPLSFCKVPFVPCLRRFFILLFYDKVILLFTQTHTKTYLPSCKRLRYEC